jgi:hypothetical protein
MPPCPDKLAEIAWLVRELAWPITAVICALILRNAWRQR